ARLRRSDPRGLHERRSQRGERHADLLHQRRPARRLLRRGGPARGTPAFDAMSLPVEGRFPSLGGATGWLHSPPLDPAALRGKVVVGDFCTYTCINWLRTLAHVRAWAETYGKLGLVMIGVHTPEFAFEHDVDNVREMLASMRVEYPIALDNDYGVWDAFANRYWPALYFIDAEGRIRHHRFGEGDEERSEVVIQQLLREAGVEDV